MKRVQYYGFARFKVLARLPFMYSSFEDLVSECSAVEMEDRSLAWGEAGSDVDACASELRNAIMEAECQCNMDFDTCLMRGLMQALNNTCRGFDVVRRMLKTMMNDTSMTDSSMEGKHVCLLLILFCPSLSILNGMFD